MTAQSKMWRLGQSNWWLCWEPSQWWVGLRATEHWFEVGLLALQLAYQRAELEPVQGDGWAPSVGPADEAKKPGTDDEVPAPWRDQWWTVKVGGFEGTAQPLMQDTSTSEPYMPVPGWLLIRLMDGTTTMINMTKAAYVSWNPADHQ